MTTTIDASTLRAAAAAEVTTELAAIDDDVTRMRRAAEIIEAAETAAETFRTRRDRLVVSLVVFDHVRGANNLAGLGRTQVSKIRRQAIGGRQVPLRGEFPDLTVDKEAYERLAVECGVKKIPNAATKLPAVVAGLTSAEARADAARKIRDAAVVAVVRGGVRTPAEVSRMIGCDRARVARIVGGAPA